MKTLVGTFACCPDGLNDMEDEDIRRFCDAGQLPLAGAIDQMAE
jgi:hypothetical protein